MKLLRGKQLKHKIIIALVIVILFNFMMPTTVVRADDGVTLGGILFEPIKDLLVTVTDGVVWIMQKILYNQDVSLLKMSNVATDVVGGLGVLAGAGGGAAAGFVIAGPVGAIVGGVIGAYVSHQAKEAILPSTLYLPIYAISPEEIFGNKVATLDVNFFKPNSYNLDGQIIVGNSINDSGQDVTKSSAETLSGIISQWYYALRNLAIVVLLCVLVYTGIKIVISSSGKDKAKYKERLMDWLIAMCLLFFMHYIMAFAVTLTEQITNAINPINRQVSVPLNSLDGYWLEIPASQNTANTTNNSEATNTTNKLSNWASIITKQNIAKLINEQEGKASIIAKTEEASIPIAIGDNINDYINAQNIYIESLLKDRCTTHKISYYQEKMKSELNGRYYELKAMGKWEDYILKGNIANRLNTLIENETQETLAVGNNNYEEDMEAVKSYIYGEMSDNCEYVKNNQDVCWGRFATYADNEHNNMKAEEEFTELANKSNITQKVWASDFVQKYGIQSGDGTLTWGTNLMGVARLELQMETTSQESSVMRQFGYTLIYMGFVIYTVLFLFRYLKRLLMLAFLTMIAPLMAMTYPLDKMKDGSAQGFNMWLKEYIFNLLIQPVHLLLYTALIGAAMDLAEQNMLYALVAFGFLLQAEKLLRKFFGFDKATTVDNGSALGGALAMQGINTLGKVLGKGNKDKKDGSTGKGGNTTRTATRKADSDKDINNLQFGSGSGRQALERRTSNNSNSNDTENNGEGNNSIDSAQQRMLDAYDENYGTDAYDPAEREAMARELNANNSYNSGIADNFRDLGYSEDDIKDILGDDYVAPLDNGSVEDNFRNLGYSEDEIKDILGESYVGPQAEALEPPEGVLESSNDALEAPTETASEQYEESPIGTYSNQEEQPTSYDQTTDTTPTLLNRAKSAASYIAPKATRLALKGTLAGAGLMVGAAAGLVSDNGGNVPKWAIAGGAAGLMAGNGLPGTVGSIANKASSSYDDFYEATHTREEIERRQNEKADKQWAKDEQAIKLYQEELGLSKEQAKKTMQKEAMTYRKYGITDDETIVKAMKAKDPVFGAAKDSDQRIMLAKMSTKVGNDQKKLQYVSETLSEKGLSKNDVKAYIAQIKKMNKKELI